LKTSRCGLFFLPLTLAGGATAQGSKVNSVLDMTEFARDWQISKRFTLDVARAMPADLYSYKPNPEEMTFGKQMIHIAVSNVFRFNQITGIEPPFPLDLSKPSASDRETELRMLNLSFDYVIRRAAQDHSGSAETNLAHCVVEGPHRS
jgi:hypothetical protein